MSVNKTPTFNLKVVLQETGLTADTLRAWERRYGLPSPQRTPGGHRLYSRRDIETVKWLMARRAEGMRIGQAVQLWQDLTASGQDPLSQAGASSEPSAASGASLSLEILRQQWITACLHYDATSAGQVLDIAFTMHAMEAVCAGILQRGLWEIGNLWQQGLASVQQEHFASDLAMRRLHALISAAPPPTHTERVLLACPPGEQHVFPLTLLTLLLRRRGWPVIHLGADVPLERMAEAVQAIQPRLVVLASQTLMTTVALREMARLLKTQRVPVAFGGRVFSLINQLHRRIPGHYLSRPLELSPPKIEQLLTEARPVPAEEPPAAEMDTLAAAYTRQRPLIEAYLRQELEEKGQVVRHLDTANRFLGAVLAAALALGDLNYISTDILWLSSLLLQHHISLAYLPIFLETYARAVQQVMGQEGAVITNWLTLEVGKLRLAFAGT